MKIFSQRTTEGLSSEGVCRTAPATPGLLNTEESPLGYYNIFKLLKFNKSEEGKTPNIFSPLSSILYSRVSDQLRPCHELFRALSFIERPGLLIPKIQCQAIT